jgi:hypothetical protein
MSRHRRGAEVALLAAAVDGYERELAAARASSATSPTAIQKGWRA